MTGVAHIVNVFDLRNRLAIGFATVIDKSRRIPLHAAIKVLSRAYRKNVTVVLGTAAERLLLVDDLPYVLDHAGARPDGARRKCTGPVDGRRFENQVVKGHGGEGWAERLVSVVL